MLNFLIRRDDLVREMEEVHKQECGVQEGRGILCSVSAFDHHVKYFCFCSHLTVFYSFSARGSQSGDTSRMCSSRITDESGLSIICCCLVSASTPGNQSYQLDSALYNLKCYAQAHQGLQTRRGDAGSS